MAAAFRRQENAIPSSSPAFGTPVHPINPRDARPLPPPAFKPAISTILPILLPPPSLRPLAFRTFTKKHNLTLSSPALQALATFVGRHCGSGWREEGTAEKVLDEVAKTWKKSGGALIVDDGKLLKNILKALEGCMAGGKIVQTKSRLGRRSSFAFASGDGLSPTEDPSRPSLGHHGSSFGMSGLQVDEDEEEELETQDPRTWLKVVSAYDQPRLVYDINKKHFDKVTTKPSLLPSPAHKTALFRDRYNIIHQRLMRSEAFQAPAVNGRSFSRADSTSVQHYYKLTPIANLLGRGGSSHVLLGLLTVTPTGTLALNDMTGSITLDLQHAKTLRGENSSWFCPGMILLIEGVYQEEYGGAGSSGLGASSGVGGTIGGKFTGFTISGPPSERRNLSLGIQESAKHEDLSMTGGFGWTDFLGLGSEKALGPKMRRLEQKSLGPDSANPERKMTVIMSEVNLDDPSVLEGLRCVLKLYAAEAEEIPLSFIVIGNFVSHPVMAGGGSGGSIDYKEYFNDLATVLIDFPVLLRNATWVFVPGDNDPWPSAFSAGASTAIPRKEVPALFTTRIKRAFAAAKAETGVKQSGPEGEVIWTTNPARVTFFGSAHEIVVFRDDITGRLHLPATTALARKLILSLLPQSNLSPFPLSTRPVNWDLGSSLSLYPLPHTLVLADAEAPAFAVTFEGCHVLNPGRFVRVEGRRRWVQWVEYDCAGKRGGIRDSRLIYRD
ncbi:DNA polymerase epsilon subunit B [Delphinella strobiligena]|nr:DNA polymerase epsilon subunit B [Delphinella strobiligena]